MLDETLKSELSQVEQSVVEGDLGGVVVVRSSGPIGFCLLSLGQIVPGAELSVGHLADAPANTLEAAHQCMPLELSCKTLCSSSWNSRHRAWNWAATWARGVAVLGLAWEQF